MHLAFDPSGQVNAAASKGTVAAKKKDNSADYKMLLDHFGHVQRQQSEYRFNIVREKRLLKHPNLETSSTALDSGA